MNKHNTYNVHIMYTVLYNIDRKLTHLYREKNVDYGWVNSCCKNVTNGINGLKLPWGAL